MNILPIQGAERGWCDLSPKAAPLGWWCVGPPAL